MRNNNPSDCGIPSYRTTPEKASDEEKHHETRKIRSGEGSLFKKSTDAFRRLLIFIPTVLNGKESV